MAEIAQTTGQSITSIVNNTVSDVCRGESVILLQQVCQLDRASFLKKRLLKENNPEVVDTLLASYRKSSTKQQEVAWRTFQEWLPKETREIDITTVLQFMQYAFDKLNLAPHTIVCYKNSLSWPLNLAFYVPLVSNLYTKMARGFFHKKPPLQPQIPQWDISNVLKFYEHINNATTDNKTLFCKCLFLIALASGNRCSELAALLKTGIVFNDNGATIPVAPKFLFKNQSLNRTPPPVSFLQLGEEALCLVTVLHAYLSRFSPKSNLDKLFVNPNTSKPLTAKRLGYWLAQMIKLASTSFTVVKRMKLGSWLFDKMVQNHRTEFFNFLWVLVFTSPIFI